MKEIRRYYWLPLSSWNLSEIFVTESVSPHSFYKIRMFGTTHNQLTDDNGKPLQSDNCLVLYPNQFSFIPKIGKPTFLLINSTALDPNFVEIDKNGLAYYFKTIYFQRGNFQLRFFSEPDKRMFLANSSVILEVKSFKKYDVDFFEVKNDKQNILYVSNTPQESNQFQIDATIASKSKAEQVYFDRAYNQIKGLIFGLLCGTIGKKSGQEIKLETELQKLKSKITALRTYFEMSETFGYEVLEPSLQLTESCEILFKSLLPNDTSNNFNGIKERIKEAGDLQQLKLVELGKQKKNIENSDAQFGEKEKNQLRDLEEQKAELKNQQERLREKRKKLEGQEKQIKRPRKNTEGYYKKAELKSEINLLQEEINQISEELKPINAAIQGINFEIGKHQAFGRTQYDSNIEEQFYKITGYINDLIFAPKEQDVQKFIPNIEGIVLNIRNLANHYFKVNNQKKISNNELDFVQELNSEILDALSNEDKTILKILTNVILSNPTSILGDISENNLNEILSVAIEELSKRKISEEIVSPLKDLLAYRLSGNGEYNIPSEQIVVRSFFAFIIKPYSAEELTKFMYSKNMQELHLAYIFWGAFFGFANMPKTFTNIIFESNDNELFEMIDGYLFCNYLKINK
jgi:hypothetical protein